MSEFIPDRLPSRGDCDPPLLDAAYLQDCVMRDGRPMVRSAILLATAVTGDPVSVHVCYLPATEALAQAAELLGPVSTRRDEDDEDDPPSFRPVRRW